MPFHDVLIVVPSFGDRPQMLRACLESLCAQTLRPRVVVVAKENHATVEALATEHGASMLTQNSAGMGAAINEGWLQDSWESEFTGWLGDDDLLTPSSIELATRRLEQRNSASMVHGRCQVVDESGRPTYLIRNGWIAAAMAGWGKNLIAQPGCLFRTELVQRVGGVDPSLRYAMDIDIYLRLRRVGPIVTSRHVLSVFRAHPGGLSTAWAHAAEQEAEEVKRRYWRHPDAVSEKLDWAARKLTLLTFEVTKRIGH